MVRIYEQVDVAAIDGTIAACSGLGAASGVYDRELQESGTLGSGTNAVSENTGSVVRSIHFESEANEPNETSWPAGDWIVRIRVTTGNSNLDWDEQYVCRVNSGGVSQATIGSAVAQAVNLTAGAKSITVAGGADAGAAATDRFYLVGGIIRSAGHGEQIAVVFNDQSIDTPFAAVAANVSSDRGILRGVLRGVMRGV